MVRETAGVVHDMFALPWVRDRIIGYCGEDVIRGVEVRKFSRRHVNCDVRVVWGVDCPPATSDNRGSSSGVSRAVRASGGGVVDVEACSLLVSSD